MEPFAPTQEAGEGRYDSAPNDAAWLAGKFAAVGHQIPIAGKPAHFLHGGKIDLSVCKIFVGRVGD